MLYLVPGMISYTLTRAVAGNLPRRIRMARNLLICCLFFPPVSLAELQFSDAWVRDMPPTVPVRAGYLSIRNPEASPLKIVAIESEAFERVEIHQTVERDGMMRMERVPELNIAADSTVQFAPGGLHLMLIQPVEPIKPGMIIQINLTFDGGGEQALELEVKKQ